MLIFLFLYSGPSGILSSGEKQNLLKRVLGALELLHFL